MRPFFHFITPISEPDKQNPFHLTGTTVSTIKGNTITFPCPAFGGPNLTVTWERENGLPKNARREQFDLILSDVDESDVGTYRCIAKATVKTENKGPEVELEAVLEHNLKAVTSPVVGHTEEGTSSSEEEDGSGEEVTERPERELLATF